MPRCRGADLASLNMVLYLALNVRQKIGIPRMSGMIEFDACDLTP